MLSGIFLITSPNVISFTVSRTTDKSGRKVTEDVIGKGTNGFLQVENKKIK